MYDNMLIKYKKCADAGADNMSHNLIKIIGLRSMLVQPAMEDLKKIGGA